VKQTTQNGPSFNKLTEKERYRCRYSQQQNNQAFKLVPENLPVAFPCVFSEPVGTVFLDAFGNRVSAEPFIRVRL